MPELMLAYRASAFFARVHIPNALMGMQVEGEAEDITNKKKFLKHLIFLRKARLPNDNNECILKLQNLGV